MALTRDFKETVRARARRDPAFRRALLREGIGCLMDGEVLTGRILLCDYINATIGTDRRPAARDRPSGTRLCGVHP